MLRRVMIDTTIAIASFRHDAEIINLLTSVQPVVSAIVLGELYLGAELATRSSEQFGYIEDLITASDVVDCTRETARRYGAIYADLQRRGQMIPINDIWIAAAALQHGVPVATHDTGHFGRVPGLNVEAW